MIRARFAIAIACAIALAGAAAAQYRHQQVAFPDLLRAHVDARLGIERLVTTTDGRPIGEPAVYVTATPQRVLLYGETLALLEAGQVPAEHVAVCASGAPCFPRLRDAIADARARLGRAVNARPKILLLVDDRVPYPTLLLLARSAAEAGAALSIELVTRRGQELVGVPVWVAPGRELALASAPNPAVIRVELDAGAARVSSDGGYLAQPVLANSRSALIDALGRLELSTGRNTYFIAGTDRTASGDVIAAIAAARDVFPHAILKAPGERPAVIR